MGEIRVQVRRQDGAWPKTMHAGDGMFKNRWFVVLLLISSCTFAAAYVGTNANAGQEPTLHFDVPTKLDKANVVVDFGHAVYLGDTLFGRCATRCRY